MNPAISRTPEGLVLRGAHVDYRLRRTGEVCGGVVVQLDAVASLDEAIDALCRTAGAGLDDESALRLTPYFGTVWSAGRGLAHWLGERPSLLRGRRVIEVGCGLGLAALVAARLGAHVHAVDVHPDAGALLRHNAALNDVVIAYHAADWSGGDALAGALGGFDVVLASDVVYEPGSAGQIAAALSALCRPGGRIVLADPGRPQLQAAVSGLEERGFTSELEIRRVRRGGDPAAGPEGEDDVFVIAFARA